VSEGGLIKPVEARAKSRPNEIAVANQGGPVVTQVELKPLAVRPQLLPAAEANAEPAVAAGSGWRWLFIVTVVLPMALASVYLLAIAAPRFTSSASFIVRSAIQRNDGRLAALSDDSAIARDETNAVNAYLTSRDIVAELAKNNDLRAILSRPGADFLFRYPTSWLPDNNEYLYNRFRWMADAKVDPVTVSAPLR
jgi:capsular polysaccharide transport system permease protein